MHRIDGAGATVDNKFTQGNPVTGVPATTVTAEWLNAVQEEIVHVIEQSGVGPDKELHTQLYEAIGKLSEVEQAGAGAVKRKVQDETRETFKVTQFMLAVEATLDNAFARAFAAFTRPGTLEIPQGFWNIGATIPVRRDIPIKIRGAGMNSTIVFYSGAGVINAMFEQSGGVSDTFEMADLTLIGNGLAACGFKSEQIIASTFEKVGITATTAAALRLNNGYSNNVINCKLYSNAGGGVQCTGVNNNNINILHTQVYDNAGIGIEVANGFSVNIAHCDVEMNAVAGIVAYDIKSLNIRGNYIERNAGTGLAYTTEGGSPENLTVKADIHILASGKVITLVRDSDVEQCVIEGNQFTPYGSGDIPVAGLSIDSPIFCSVADGLRVTNNEVLAVAKIKSMVSFYNNNTKSAAYATVIDQNTVDTIGFLGVGASGFAFNTLHNIDSPLAQSPHNYITQNLFDFAIQAGTDGYFRRSANDFSGYPVYAIGGGDYTFGVDIDLSKHPELKGRLVWFGVWYHVDDAGSTVVLGLGGNTDSDGTVTDTAFPASEFRFKSVAKLVGGADTTLLATIRRAGAGVNPVLLCHPVVSLAGFGAGRYPIPSAPPVWKKNSFPIEGSWKLGDRVLNSAPSVGAPKAWQCTAVGTPGTWVSEGNL